MTKHDLVLKAIIGPDWQSLRFRSQNHHYPLLTQTGNHCDKSGNEILGMFH